MTYAFGRTLSLGSQAWQCTAGPGGQFKVAGNPSISEQVSQYMVSLRRCKVGQLSTLLYIFPSDIHLGTNRQDTHKCLCDYTRHYGVAI